MLKRKWHYCECISWNAKNFYSALNLISIIKTPKYKMNKKNIAFPILEINVIFVSTGQKITQPNNIQKYSPPDSYSHITNQRNVTEPGKSNTPVNCPKHITHSTLLKNITQSIPITKQYYPINSCPQNLISFLCQKI